MTPVQRRMVRHALGLGEDRKRSYRNRYVAALGGPQEDEWNALCRDGLAMRGRDRAASVGFCLTEAGALEALDPGEILDFEDFPALYTT